MSATGRPERDLRRAQHAGGPLSEHLPGQRSDPDAAGALPAPADAIRAELDRVLASDEFATSARLRDMLRFLVDESLAGRVARLKGYRIAVEVFHRDPGFDADTDPLVRIQAGRLRRALDRYYATAGARDPLRIGVPKGGYVPAFTVANGGEVATVATDPGRGPAEGTRPPVVAVLPFQSLSSDPEQAYFAEGLAAELLLGDVFTGDRLHDVGPGDEHVRRVLHHEDEVGHGGAVDRAAGARAHDDRQLRHNARRLAVGVKNLGIAAQTVHALLDARAAGIVHGHKGTAIFDGHVHHLDDLVGVHLAQGAAHHRRVLGRGKDPPPVHQPKARNHPIPGPGVLAPHIRLISGHDQRIDLLERIRVKEQINALPGRQPPLLVLPRHFLRCPRGQRPPRPQLTNITLHGCLLMRIVNIKIEHGSDGLNGFSLIFQNKSVLIRRIRIIRVLF